MRNKKLFVISCILAVLSISAGFYTFADNASDRKLIFGPVVSELKGTDISTSTFKGAGSSGVCEKLYFSIDTKDVSLRKIGEYDYVNIGNLKSSGGNPGEPNVPRKIFTLTLPKNTEINGVEVTDITYRHILTPLKISPVPQPMPITRKKGRASLAQTEPNTEPNKEIYSSVEFFPGEVVTYYTGCDRENRYVYVRFYPLQYSPKDKQAVLITSATIEVYYSHTEETTNKGISGVGGPQPLQSYTGSADCLIIYPEKYEDAADSIINLHETLWQPIGEDIATDTMTVELIDALPYGDDGELELAAFPDALCYDGGYTTHPGEEYNRDDIWGYDNDLAQRILTFIQELKVSADGGHAYYPNLEYIVILGNASGVPPSYYVYNEPSDETTGSYDTWVPTDYFYSLENYDDYIPEFKLGRLSVRDRGVALETGTLSAVGDLPGHDNPLYDINLDESTVYDATKNWSVDPGDDGWVGCDLVFPDTGLTYSIHDSGDTWLLIRGRDLPTEGVVDGIDYEIRDTRDEMLAMVQKIEDWYSAMDYTNPAGYWFRKVALCGGKTFDTSYYLGELGCNEVINTFDYSYDGKSLLHTMDVTKYYHTDSTDYYDVGDAGVGGDASRFKQADVEDTMDGTTPHGFVYLYGHGSGTSFAFDTGDLTATEVLGLGDSDSVPIVLSVSCDNAAYDASIMNGSATTVSFGESIPLSGCDNNPPDGSGGIAYIGGSRTCYVSSGVAIDNGYLYPLSQTLMPEILRYVFKQYHEKENRCRLGHIFSKAIENYVGANVMTGSVYDQRTVFEYTLLGDPALLIPVRPSSTGNDYNVPFITALSPVRYNSFDMPVYEVEDGSSVTVTIDPAASSDVEITLFDIVNDTADDRTTQAHTDNYPFDVDDTDAGPNNRGPGFYFVRVAGKDAPTANYNKEGRLYLEVVNKFDTENMFADNAAILLVDDDDESTANDHPLSPWTDYEDVYEQALQDAGWAWGTGYVVWHVENDDPSNTMGPTTNEGRHGEITQEVLDYMAQDRNRVVVWFTGDDNATTFTSSDRTNLAEYLDNGGRLFVVGQDIGYDIWATPFYQNYLHASFVQDDIQRYEVDGVVGDELGGGFENVSINPGSPGSGAGNQVYPSEIDPYGGYVSSCFIYGTVSGPGGPLSTGSAGIRFCDDDSPPTCPEKSHALVYLAFGLEGVDTRDDASSPYSGRAQLIEEIIDWLQGKGGRCAVAPPEPGTGEEDSGAAQAIASGCFIATACYGTPMAEEVGVLCDFRDEYLLKNPIGRFFVRTYYKTSPKVASFISEHPRLKKFVGLCLKPVVGIVDSIFSE